MPRDEINPLMRICEIFPLLFLLIHRKRSPRANAFSSSTASGPPSPLGKARWGRLGTRMKCLRREKRETTLRSFLFFRVPAPKYTDL